MAFRLPNSEPFHHLLRGLLMGGADIIPGVSGGTVALILGIYPRLVTAISHVDVQLLRLIAGRQWRRAAEYLDLRFLASLGLGIAIGIVSLASLVHYLLEHHRPLTIATFFGLILGSSWLVGRAVQPRDQWQAWRCLSMGTLGIALGGAIAMQNAVGTRSGLAYTFLCGAVAICAMILPGISGSHVLLLLGKYAEITGIIKQLPRLDVSLEQLVTLGVFAVGCALGLIVFSKFLRWLLGRWHALTMSLLCGFMLGSLYRVWPFQQDLSPTEKDFSHKVFEPHLPATVGPYELACLLVAVAAVASVLLLDAWARRSQHPPAH